MYHEHMLCRTSTQRIYAISMIDSLVVHVSISIHIHVYVVQVCRSLSLTYMSFTDLAPNTLFGGHAVIPGIHAKHPHIMTEIQNIWKTLWGEETCDNREQVERMGMEKGPCKCIQRVANAELDIGLNGSAISHDIFHIFVQ